METEVFFKVDGEEYCNNELALSILLQNNVLFANSREYSQNGKWEGHTVVLFVICNDIFAWGGADAQDLPLSEVGLLYKMWDKDNKWGSAKWCCIRRNEKPQKPVVDAMKKDGSWCEIMEGLAENHYDKFCKEKYGH